MNDPGLDTGHIERRIDAVGTKVDQMSMKVDKVESQMEEVRKDLKKLRRDFLEMMIEQRRTAALEQAATELVGVRQEMDKKFGNYSVVRNTMVGILQATDTALVRKATISTVSEELMISTPDYWLAPVLVALAAWINNNRDLAERAIREAVKRDNEHTSLAMALVCRRNNRTATCYEWLARYFSTQNAARIDADAMVYIDAYINGIFGTDEKHLCDDYMAGWIEQIRNQRPEFESEQSKSWAEYFTNYEEDMSSRYPALKVVVKEFDYINKYLGKVEAIESISNDFADLKASDVDERTLAEQVDRHLMELVNSDDSKERSLRRQEEYLLAVKAFGGDVERARELVNRRRDEKRQQTMNIIDQMTRSMRDRGSSADVHKKKTAIRFLGPYINGGFNRYRKSDIPEFPQAITLDFDGWTSKAVSGDEGNELRGDYVRYVGEEKKKELAELGLKIAKGNKSHKIAAVVLAVLGVFLFAFVNQLIGILLLAGAGYCLVKMSLSGKQHTAEADKIEAKYSKRIQEGCSEIDLALNQWKSAKEAAAERSDLLKLEKVA